MTECVRCGDCCESFPLNTPERADIYGKRILADVGRTGVSKEMRSGVDRKQAAWLANVIPIAGPERLKDGGLRWRYRCPVFDPVSRLCTDHTNRPPVCSRFPWYGRDDHGSYKNLPPRCSFIADTDDVKMLPIVEVRHG